MPTPTDAYADYSAAGLKPIRCFPNSLRPLWTEIQGGDFASDEDASGWEDFNVAVRANKRMSAVVFRDITKYMAHKNSGSVFATAPTVVQPDARIAVWFKNKEWVAHDLRGDDCWIVNTGLLPAPPSSVGGIEAQWMQPLGTLPEGVMSAIAGVTKAADWRYGDDVIPLKGLLSFGYPQPSPYMANGILDDMAKLAIIGEPKVGKSRAALNLAFCLALKDDFIDLPIMRAARVLFVQFEVSEARFQQRIHGISHEYNLPSDTNLPLFFATLPALQLDVDYGMTRLLKLLDACDPEVLFLDPLYKIHNREENSASEMQSLYDNLDTVIRERGLSVILTHHVNKRSDVRGWARVRGSGQLPAWVDSLLTLDSHNQGKTIEATGLLRSGEGFVKTVSFNANHKIQSLGDQTALEIYCSELVINSPQMTRKQMASLVAKEFGITLTEVHLYFRQLEDKGYILPQ